ncbi:MAG: hypothetical protein ACK4GT_05050 [Pararhodobacter sp.]
MRSTAIAVTAILSLTAPAPVQAQEADTGRLRGMFDDMLGAVNPWVSDLVEKLGDLSGWHAPEVLPNGDILIRRREEGQEPEGMPEPAPDAGSGAGSGEVLEL